MPGLEMLAVVSPDGLATDVFIDDPLTRGSQHGKTVFLRSGILERIANADGTRPPLLFDRARTGVDTRDGYTEAIVLFSATRGHPLTEAQRAFNDPVEGERVIVYNYFGRLRGVWQILRGPYRGNLKRCLS